MTTPLTSTSAGTDKTITIPAGTIEVGDCLEIVNAPPHFYLIRTAKGQYSIHVPQGMKEQNWRVTKLPLADQ